MADDADDEAILTAQERAGLVALNGMKSIERLGFAQTDWRSLAATVNGGAYLGNIGTGGGGAGGSSRFSTGDGVFARGGAGGAGANALSRYAASNRPAAPTPAPSPQPEPEPAKPVDWVERRFSGIDF